MKKTDFLHVVAETAREHKKSVIKEHAPLMNEKKIAKIYEQYKHVLKENVAGFTNAIRGVFYEYADGIVEATPETVDPVRDPDNAIKQGEDMEKKAAALKNAAKTVKSINATSSTTTSTSPSTSVAPESSKKETSVPIPSLLEMAKKASIDKIHYSKDEKKIDHRNRRKEDKKPKSTNDLEENILPAVVEIIKQAENPRATKKELLEMFKLNKKSKI